MMVSSIFIDQSFPTFFELPKKLDIIYSKLLRMNVLKVPAEYS